MTTSYQDRTYRPGVLLQVKHNTTVFYNVQRPRGDEAYSEPHQTFEIKKDALVMFTGEVCGNELRVIYQDKIGWCYHLSLQPLPEGNGFEDDT